MPAGNSDTAGDPDQDNQANLEGNAIDKGPEAVGEHGTENEIDHLAPTSERLSSSISL